MKPRIVYRIHDDWCGAAWIQPTLTATQLRDCRAKATVKLKPICIAGYHYQNRS